MSLFVETYGTIFEAKFESKSDQYVLKTLSISEGKDQEGKGLYSYWNAHFVGDAKNAVASLPEKTNIKFKGVVKKNYNKDTKKEYVYISVYQLETAQKAKETQGVNGENEVFPDDADLNISDEELPF